MRKNSLFAALVALVSITAFAIADENEEIIEKVMKKGMKGDESPFAKVVGGTASAEETTGLATMIHTLKGTKAPVGDQAKYEAKVAELIAAMDAVAGGAKDEVATKRLKAAGNCKACHTDHKPKA